MVADKSIESDPTKVLSHTKTLVLRLGWRISPIIESLISRNGTAMIAGSRRFFDRRGPEDDARRSPHAGSGGLLKMLERSGGLGLGVRGHAIGGHNDVEVSQVRVMRGKED